MMVFESAKVEDGTARDIRSDHVLRLRPDPELPLPVFALDRHGCRDGVLERKSGHTCI
jgi:hypothetical protein